ncbi:MAG: hypothetical protein MJY97_02030 [Bacteroidales bacterium]|nr:hypothetical protein [Bacteroidales bacterium]
MTAIVGVLNKRAVAIAADSAMTVSNDGKTKIYNNTKKIFDISPDIPVGIMVCGNLEFMSTPWDVIISLYREYRKGKAFHHLQDYSKDFIEFVRSCKFLQDPDAGRGYLISELGSFFYRIKADVVERAKTEPDKPLLDLYRIVLQESIDMYREAGVSEEMKRFSYRQICKLSNDAFSALKDLIKEENCPLTDLDEWRKGYYEYLRSQCYLQDSEIIFTGYGRKDAFPAIQSIIITGIVDGRVRYRYDTDDKIEINGSAFIIPFAQTDVMMTLMKGISPNLYCHMIKTEEESVETARATIIEQLKADGVPDSFIEKVSGISFEELNSNYRDKAQEFIKANYVDGIIDAVDCFSVSEMAELAENLILMTGLQRHFSSSEESVGGPVNVAVITKSGGFQWSSLRSC